MIKLFYGEVKEKIETLINFSRLLYPMGQQEIYSFLLKNHSTWFTSREIVDLTGLSMGSVSKSLKRLRESKQIDFMENPKRRETFRYQINGE